MTRLFWLTYLKGKDVQVVIQPAQHLGEARMRVQLRGQEGAFNEGHELDEKTARKLPNKVVEIMLTATEAQALLRRLA
jgi:hypothetical protein